MNYVLPSLLGGCSFLYHAAEHNFVRLATVLIQAKANVNQQHIYANGKSCLSIASTNGHAEIVKLLLAQPDIDVDLADDSRAPPLHWAVLMGKFDIVELLLDANADVNRADDKGDVALTAGLVAAPMVQLLLQRRANVNHRDNAGRSLLHVAAEGGADQVLSILLEANANVDPPDVDGLTPLVMAVFGGHLATVQQLIAARADVNRLALHGHSALLYTAQAGHVSVVNELLTAKADPNVGDFRRNWTPLMMAAVYDRTECIPALLAGKADIDLASKTNDTALGLAVQKRRVAAAALLLQSGADVLKKGQKSPRQWARARNAQIQALFYALCADGQECVANSVEKNTAFWNVINFQASLYEQRFLFAFFKRTQI